MHCVGIDACMHDHAACWQVGPSQAAAPIPLQTASFHGHVCCRSITLTSCIKRTSTGGLCTSSSWDRPTQRRWVTCVREPFAWAHAQLYRTRALPDVVAWRHACNSSTPRRCAGAGRLRGLPHPSQDKPPSASAPCGSCWPCISLHRTAASGIIWYLQILEETTLERMLDYHLCEWEALERRVLPACSRLAGRPVITKTVVLDLKGLSIKNFGGAAQRILKAVAHMDQVRRTYGACVARRGTHTHALCMHVCAYVRVTTFVRACVRATVVVSFRARRTATLSTWARCSSSTRRSSSAPSGRASTRCWRTARAEKSSSW